MKLSSRYSLLTVTAIYILGLVSVVAEDCNVGEEQLEFTFFLDEDSLSENGWSLTCDDQGTIWNVPVGSLESSGRVQLSDTPFVKDHVCVSKNATCHFTLEDLFGDGLVFPGYYFLTYGATTIVVSEEGEEFFEKAFCFGPNCNIPPKEINEDCDDLYLFFQVNDNPEQSSVQIICDDEIKYTKSDFTVPKEVAEFETCLPIGKCCSLEITDSAFDGMAGGKIFLEWATKVVFAYDNSNPYEFGTISRNFGDQCSEFTRQRSNQGDLASSVVSTRMEDDGSSPVDETIISTTTATTTTTANIQQEASTNDKMNMSTGVIVALVVGGSLILIGLVVCLVRSLCDSSEETEEEKDLEARTTRSKDSDQDEES